MGNAHGRSYAQTYARKERKMSGVNLVVGIALAVAAPTAGLLLFFLWQRQRPPEEKPYRLNVKTMAVAVLTEIIVAGAGIGAAFVWAFQSGNDAATRTIMIVGGLVFVGFEAARIPCAINVRANPSRFWCVAAFLGVLWSGGMDALVLTQTQTVTIQPRLAKVQAAGAALAEARDAKAGNGAAIKLAQDAVAKAATVYEQAQARLRAIAGDLIHVPRCRNCGTATESLMRDGLREANAAVAAAKKEIDATNLRLARVDPKAGDEALRSAEHAYREAISGSQLHVVAAALLGTDASKVSDAQVGWMKRILIVAPALLASLIGSLLSMLAVTPIKPPPSAEVRNVAETITYLRDANVQLRADNAALKRATASAAAGEPVNEGDTPAPAAAASAPQPEHAPAPAPAENATQPEPVPLKPPRRVRRAAAKSKAPDNPKGSAASPWWAGLPTTRSPPLSPAATPAPQPPEPPAKDVTQLEEWRMKQPLKPNGSMRHED
jgi:hypothetical protein